MVRRFDVGDEVQVRVGALMGRHGIIASVEIRYGDRKGRRKHSRKGPSWRGKLYFVTSYIASLNRNFDYSDRFE